MALHSWVIANAARHILHPMHLGLEMGPGSFSATTPSPCINTTFLNLCHWLLSSEFASLSSWRGLIAYHLPPVVCWWSWAGSGRDSCALEPKVLPVSCWPLPLACLLCFLSSPNPGSLGFGVDCLLTIYHWSLFAAGGHGLAVVEILMP